MQPWFMPFEGVAQEMRRLIPSAHLSKMRFYYEDFGCIRCGEHKPRPTEATDFVNLPARWSSRIIDFEETVEKGRIKENKDRGSVEV